MPVAVPAHLYTYSPPNYRISQSDRIFILLLVSLSNDLGNPVFDCVGVAGFKSSANAFLLALLLSPFLSLTVFTFSSFTLSVGIIGLVSLD